MAKMKKVRVSPGERRSQTPARYYTDDIQRLVEYWYFRSLPNPLIAQKLQTEFCIVNEEEIVERIRQIEKEMALSARHMDEAMANVEILKKLKVMEQRQSSVQGYVDQQLGAMSQAEEALRAFRETLALDPYGSESKTVPEAVPYPLKETLALHAMDVSVVRIWQGVSQSAQRARVNQKRKDAEEARDKPKGLKGAITSSSQAHVDRLREVMGTAIVVYEPLSAIDEESINIAMSDGSVFEGRD